MSRIKNVILPPLVLFLICVIVTAALAGTNQLTAEKIHSMEKQAQEEAMFRVMDADAFEEKTLTYEGADVPYDVAKSGNQTVGYVFVTTGKGYGGAVQVMTAVDLDGTVLSMEVLSASDETPGLGANALNPEWWEQFKGMSGNVAVKKDGGEVDALTGATITSRAVSRAVNTALEYFHVLEVE